MHPADLERLVDRELRRLPPPRAPQTLLPRIMAAVVGSPARPWYRRAWFTWPTEWQVAAVAALIVLTAGATMLLIDAQSAAAGAASTFAGRALADVAAAARYASVAKEIAEAFWSAMLEPLVPYVFALVLLMCVACAAFGSALNHVLLGRMSEQ